MSELDEFLGSLGIEAGSEAANVAREFRERHQEDLTLLSPAVVVDAAITEPSQTEVSISISETDFDNILQENGIPPFPTEAEEILSEGLPIISEDRIDDLPINDSNALDTSSGEQTSIGEALAEALAGEETTTPSDSSEGNTSQEPLFPPNSPTLVVDESTSRFSGAEWYNEIQTKRVILAGLGGIGSWTALLLGRMGLNNLTMYDDDRVEATNMSGQLYSRDNIGQYKVTAMSEHLRAYTSVYGLTAIERRYDSHSEFSEIMICGFDNMQARRTFFNGWKNSVVRARDKSKCLFIDGRLSIDTLQVFCIQGDDNYHIQLYEEKYLFSDEEAEETLCSLKQTSYMAAMIGAIITNVFTNWVAQSLDPVIPYDVPFFTEYAAQHMLFKTES